MRVLKYISFGMLVLVGIVLSWLNPESVAVHYLFGSKTLPLSILMVAMLGIGLLVGLLMSLWTYLRLKREVMGLRRKLKLTQQELDKIRY